MEEKYITSNVRSGGSRSSTNPEEPVREKVEMEKGEPPEPESGEWAEPNRASEPAQEGD